MVEVTMNSAVYGVETFQAAGNPFIPVLVILVIAQVVALAVWSLSTFLGPKRPSAHKEAPFEFGNPSSGVGGRRFAVKYYLVTLFFLIFDLEAAFIYPWAVLLRKLSWGGAVEMLFFLLLVTTALAYVWKKGALEWET